MVYEFWIRTTPESLWAAITDPQVRAKYSFGTAPATDGTVGQHFEVSHAATGTVLGTGTTLECDPPRRLVQTMTCLWSEDVKAEGETRVSWEIEPVADSCRLTLTHDRMRDGANSEIYGGWPQILSGLKTWLESGQLLTTSGSLMYAAVP